MIFFALKDDCIQCKSGYGSAWGVTRYSGEHWDRVAAELICGVADVFQDVGIIVTGNPWDAQLSSLKDADSSRWRCIDASDRQHESVWAFSENRGWTLVPDDRESVEDAMTWTMWGKADDLTSPRTTAFPDYSQFRHELDSRTWDVNNGDLDEFVRHSCLERSLFHMTWGPCSWRLYPGSIEMTHLLRLAMPVVTRINAVFGE